MSNVLSNDTKRIIDDARDTLVGQIPVPMMQCQQITLALTYKFMSDDDQRAVDLGGRRHYFAGDLEEFDWSRIVSSAAGRHPAQRALSCRSQRPPESQSRYLPYSARFSRML